jgi:regulator of sigma E protease
MIQQWAFAIVVISATFLLLIAPHEGGHFAVAKLCRIRVIEFSIGMGPRLVSWIRSRTLYALRLLPVGGYVRLGGMEPGDYDDPNGFHSKPAHQRILVLLAGPAVNFLVASLIITGIFLTQVNSDPGKINDVEPNTPAAVAGLKSGDTVETVNGVPLRSSAQLRSIEQQNRDRPLTLTVRHADGSQSSITVTPRYDSAAGAYLMGIHAALTVSVTDAFVKGATFPFVTSGEIVGGMYLLVSGQIPGGPLGPEGFTGPVGIAAISNEQAQTGVLSWLGLVALLSVALGFFNLLPIPPLDGGRIVVVLLEALRRRPFDRDREMRFQRAALAALLALVAVVTVFDFQRLINHQFPGLR